MGSHPYSLTGREYYGDVFCGKRDKSRSNRRLGKLAIQEELNELHLWTEENFWGDEYDPPLAPKKKVKLTKEQRALKYKLKWQRWRKIFAGWGVKNPTPKVTWEPVVIKWVPINKGKTKYIRRYGLIKKEVALDA